MKRWPLTFVAIVFALAIQAAPARAGAPSISRVLPVPTAVSLAHIVPLTPGTTAFCTDGTSTLDGSPATACSADGGVLHWLVQPLQTASAPIANADAVVPMARLVDVQGPESAGWASFGGGSAGSSDSSGNATDAGSAAAGDHTYYASTAANASTIYCDDDPGWQDLSPQDLVSFPSLAAAMAQLPDYDLHRPC